MKRFILFLFVFSPILILAQSIQPERTWHDPASASHSKWYTKKPGSTIFAYNGRLYAFNYWDDGNYNGAHTYVFTVNQDETYGAMKEFKLGSARTNKLSFGYKNECCSFDPGSVIGKTFCFQYNNRMWYFQQIHEAAGEHENEIDESFECFAQFPLDTMQSCATYYNTSNPPPSLVKLGAFQLDSNLYFICRAGEGDNGAWSVEEYGYNSSNNHFSNNNNTVDLSQVPTNHDMLGGIIKRIDKDGNEYIIVNTYERGASAKIWKLTPTVGTNNKTSFTCSSFCESTPSYNAAMTIVSGSIKGNRTSDANTYYADRFTAFSICQNKNSDGIHPIYAVEYGIDDCDGQCSPNTKFLYDNSVTIPTSTAPSTGAGSYYLIEGAAELIPEVYTNAFEGSVDGYRQNVWVCYPDGDKHWNSIVLTSDTWRMNNEPIVSSTDLWDKDTYPGIDGLWSLIGICDGGPPCAVDWDVWENSTDHPQGSDPTELEFTVITGHETEVVSTYEDQWSVGENLEISKHISKLEASLSEQFKYSSTFKNTVSNSSEVKKTLTATFALMESNQDTAVLIWAIPTITRYPFSLFPWWDSDLTHPVPYSDQYMFRTAGISIIQENVPISQSPFDIEEPNAADMNDWKIANRPDIWDADLYNGVGPIMNPTWTGNQVGQSPTYEITANSSDSYEQATEWEIETELEASVPKVFKVGVSGSYKVSYSTETTVKNNYGTEIDCSLANLKSIGAGPLVNSLHLSVYWFRYTPFQNGTYPNWWYWEDFGDQKPWYIAYVTNDTKESIQLETPQNHEVTGWSDLYFSWMTDPSILENYTIIIANSSYMIDGSILYTRSVGKGQNLSLDGFTPEAGKTYYWRVKGMTWDGKPVWSDIRSFTMKEDQDQVDPGLKALIYPNPAGKNNLHIAVDPVVEGVVTVQLTTLNGVVIDEKAISSPDALPLEITFSGNNIPAGMYLAVIRSGDEKVVRKVVVR